MMTAKGGSSALQPPNQIGVTHVCMWAGYLGRRNEELWIQGMSWVPGQLRDSLFGLLGEESNQLLICQGLWFWK